MVATPIGSPPGPTSTKGVDAPNIPLRWRDICRTGRAGRQRAVLIALGLGILIALGALMAAVIGLWTPWASRYVQGVDVSHHQGAIDWRALASQDIRFAYIKATEGVTHVDTRFATNWEQAGAVGLYRGAYHFFTLCQSGGAQAANFIAVVPRTEGALPHALDMEHMGPCREGPTMTDVVGEMDAWLDLVEARYGARPLIYTTREFHDAHLRDVTGERFWIRSIGVAPRFREGEWVIWQHHNKARRRGVSGPVDLNAFRGDADTLAAFAATRSAAP